MFFHWFEKERRFKKGAGVKGQIAPFLIVVLVVLIIAAISTVNIGRVALNKTETANSADSGSLAGASSMAGILNGMAESNQILHDYFYIIRDGSVAPWADSATEEYEDAMDNVYIGLGLTSLTMILTSIGSYVSFSSWFSVPRVVPEDCTKCSGAPVAIFLCYFAGDYLNEAYRHIQLYVSDIINVRSQVQYLYNFQKSMLCDSIIDGTKRSMDQVPESIRSIAFGNANISGKLSTTQQDAFDDWLDDSSSWTYPWTDSAGGSHSVSVNADMPGYPSYTVQHTVLNYSEIDDLLEEAQDKGESAANLMSGVSYGLLGTAAVFSLATAFMIAYYISCIFGCVDSLCKAWSWICWVGRLAVWWFSMLVSIACAAIGGYFLYDSFKDLEEAMEGLNLNGSVGIGTGCADDYIFVKIESISIRDYVTVTSTQVHPNMNLGLATTRYPTVTSSSTSKFGGGDVGAMSGGASYNSWISSTD